MDAVGIVLRVVGAFYALAGMFLLRNLAMDRLMDQMLTAISMAPQPAKEAQRRWLWGVSGLAIGMGGIALMVLSLWALPLFALGLLSQWFYLAWARTAFPPESEDEIKGRRQTTNAANLYAIATVGVFWAASSGRLHAWDDLWALAIPAFGVMMLASVARHFLWSPRRVQDDWNDGETFETDAFDAPPASTADRVRLEPHWYNQSLLDAETGQPVDAAALFGIALAERVEQWGQVFRFHDPDGEERRAAEFVSVDDEIAHRNEALRLIEAMEAVLGEGNVEGPVYPPEIRHSKAAHE